MRLIQRDQSLVAAATDGKKGLAATFSTREGADLAVEHLVQEHGVDPLAIFVEAVGDDNSVGADRSGGDSSAPGTPGRDDAPLNGTLRVTVVTDGKHVSQFREVLAEAGAAEVRVI
jgi:hypothetical protein